MHESKHMEVEISLLYKIYRAIATQGGTGRVIGEGAKRKEVASFSLHAETERLYPEKS